MATRRTVGTTAGPHETVRRPRRPSRAGGRHPGPQLRITGLAGIRPRQPRPPGPASLGGQLGVTAAVTLDHRVLVQLVTGRREADARAQLEAVPVPGAGDDAAADRAL